MNEISRDGTTKIALGNTHPFPSIDAKLIVAMWKMLEEPEAEPLYNKMLIEEKRLQDVGRVMSGRQLLFEMRKNFKVSRHAHSMYGVEDVLRCTWIGDNWDDVETWLNQLNKVIANSGSDLTDEVVGRHAIHELRKSSDFAIRACVDKWDRTSEAKRDIGKFLERIKDEIDRRLVERNKEMAVSYTHLTLPTTPYV